MAIPSGLGAQFGFVDESTYGTPVVVTRFLEFVDESIKLEIDRLESNALRVGQFRQRSDRWVAGSRSVTGDSNHILVNKGDGLLLKHMFGSAAVATIVDSNYVQTFTPGDLPTGATIQVGRPDLAGTAQPFTYHGMKVSGWEMSADVDDFLRAKVSWMGEDEDTSTGLATASFPASASPFVFTQGVLSGAGAPVTVRNFSLQASNPVSDRRKLGSALRLQPLTNGMREYTGSLDAEFLTLTDYNRFTAGTAAALVLTFTGPILGGATTTKLIITATVRYDGDTPNVGGPDEIRLTLPFKVIEVAANDFKVEYTSTDAAA